MNKALSRKRAQAVADYLNKWFGQESLRSVSATVRTNRSRTTDTPRPAAEPEDDFELLGQ